MDSQIEPFLATGRELEVFQEGPLNELRREFISRPPSVIPSDERSGLDRLASMINTTRELWGVSYKEMALSASPRPFNPTYLRLMTMGLIRRSEISDEVFSTLARLLQVNEDSLRGKFQVEETARPQGIIAVLLGKMRSSAFRIVAPIDAFASRRPVAPAAATLGDGLEQPAAFRSGECFFDATGFRVGFIDSREEGLIVTVESTPDGASRVPGDLRVTVVSVEDGSPKAGPFGFDRGRAECGRINLGPWDRLVIEGGSRD